MFVAIFRVLDTEDTGGCEHTHEATEALELGWVERDLGDYLGEGGCTAMVMDGIRDAEIQGRLECHGLDEAKGVVPELKLSIQQGLASVWVERHGSRAAARYGFVLG